MGKSKKDIIADIDLIVGKNSEVTDETHMDLVDEIADYIEATQDEFKYNEYAEGFISLYGEPDCVKEEIVTKILDGRKAMISEMLDELLEFVCEAGGQDDIDTVRYWNASYFEQLKNNKYNPS